MKLCRKISVAIGLMAVFGPAAANGQVTVPTGPTHPHGGHHRITPDQKAASDRYMSNGLGQLQAAASALQGNSTGNAIANLTSAVADMKEALPIYHGHRENSIHEASHAIQALQRGRKNGLSRAAVAISRAIASARLALQQSSTSFDDMPL